VKELLCHYSLICVDNFTIHTTAPKSRNSWNPKHSSSYKTDKPVRALECNLHERIGRKVFRHDEALSIPAALQISKHMH
jgi:hypothetical protein